MRLFVCVFSKEVWGLARRTVGTSYNSFVCVPDLPACTVVMLFVIWLSLFLCSCLCCDHFQITCMKNVFAHMHKHTHTSMFTLIVVCCYFLLIFFVLQFGQDVCEYKRYYIGIVDL